MSCHSKFAESPEVSPQLGGSRFGVWYGPTIKGNKNNLTPFNKFRSKEKVRDRSNRQCASSVRMVRDSDIDP